MALMANIGKRNKKRSSKLSKTTAMKIAFAILLYCLLPSDGSGHSKENVQNGRKQFGGGEDTKTMSSSFHPVSDGGMIDSSEFVPKPSSNLIRDQVPRDTSKPVPELQDYVHNIDALFAIEPGASISYDAEFGVKPTVASTNVPEMAGAIIADSEASLDRQKKVWDLIATFDTYKTSNLYELVNEVRTLKRFRVILLPFWWDGEDITDPLLTIDVDNVDQVMAQTRQYYLDMSWNKMDLQWQILPQQVLTGVPKSEPNPSFDDTVAAASAIVNQHHEKGEDYDAIGLIFNPADQYPFSGLGYGSLSGGFMWLRTPIYYRQVRHEVGHMFGHPHHKKYSYEYRNKGRLNGMQMLEDWDGLDIGHDMYDFMSGGNDDLPFSHFAPGSKWFYNWIEDSSIIHLQPEGVTPECPNCAAPGSFQIVPFDNKNLPPSPDRKMGIHIPIAVENGKLYSFWLSYLSPIDGIDDGLSILFTEFTRNSISPFGLLYDSHRYFAFGDMDKKHAFVLVGTCYYIFPSSFMKDRDYEAANGVRPVVCVDAINSGSMDVTISFADLQNPPVPSGQVNPISMTMNCSQTPVDITFDGTKFNSIHVQNTGANGDVSISMCSGGPAFSDNVASAYLLDDYPHWAVRHGYPASYGAFKRQHATDLWNCCEPGMAFNIEGAKVVRIKQDKADFLHLNEIEIFDENGVNVALNGRCFSFSRGWGGDPNCLNDGITGTFPETCNSHSSSSDINNFDYCVLNEATTIRSIKVWPWNDPSRSWMTNRLDNLILSVYAGVSGIGQSAQFLGELYTQSLMNVFGSSQRDAREFDVTLVDSLDCPNKNQGAKVVRIKQDKADFLHLNEIEIFDENGVNVALNGHCFSFSRGWGGDPNCLNDGITGTFPETCNSHSSNSDISNFDYCVLDEATIIRSIKVWPWNDPSRTWMTNRLDNLILSVYTDVNGIGESAQFLGEIYTKPLMNVFGSSQRDGREFVVTPHTLTYRSDYDHTYIAIPPSRDSTTTQTSLTLTCALNACLPNSYKLNGECVSCPPNSYSPSGSIDVSACTLCPDGTFLSGGKFGQTCTISTQTTEFASSRGWRIWASDKHTLDSYNYWGVREIEFYNNTDCSGDKITNALGTPISSGYNDGGPEKAFDESDDPTFWDGRKDGYGFLWVGLLYKFPVSVKCLKLQNAQRGHSVTELRVQALNSETNHWENAWVHMINTGDGASTIIPMNYPFTSQSAQAQVISGPLGKCGGSFGDAPCADG